MSVILLHKPCRALHWIRIHKLYMSAFPKEERKPFSAIVKMHRKNKADVWCCRRENSFIGFVTVIIGEKSVLVDYFAVEEKYRGCGFGSEILRNILERYKGKGVFAEIESAYEECENQKERLKRKSFYLRNGMEQMNVMADVFGVKMELLGFDCDMDFKDYKRFYYDNISPWASEHIKEEKHPEPVEQKQRSEP